MSVLELIVTAASDEGSGFPSWLAGGIGAAIGVAIIAAIGRRRAKASAQAGSSGEPILYGFSLSPAPLLVETIATLRPLYGETAPMPKNSRMTRPAFSITASGVAISEGKAGLLVSIPTGDIVSVSAAPSRVTALVPSYPSVWLQVRHDATEIALPLAPLLGGSQNINAAKSQELAAEVAAQLGVPKV